MDRAARMFLIEAAMGLLAGLVATQATNLAQKPLGRMTPERVKRRERRVGPGDTSSAVAAERVAGRLGLSRGGRRMERLGKAVHFGTGMAWGPVYGLLQRHAGLRPVGAGLATGAAMSLVLDEGLVPALGLSAPNGDYPLPTHVRGLAAHLVFGAAAALTAEAAYRLTDTGPGSLRAGM